MMIKSPLKFSISDSIEFRKIEKNDKFLRKFLHYHERKMLSIKWNILWIKNENLELKIRREAEAWNEQIRLIKEDQIKNLKKLKELV